MITTYSVTYTCTDCEEQKDSAVDGVTIIHNLHRDDETICDDCMDDMADMMRDYYFDQQVEATYEEN